MTSLDFYKFIHENDIEYNFDKDDVIIFVNLCQIEAFYKLLSFFDFQDEGLSCNMKDGYFAFYVSEICERHNINLNDIFKKQTQ